MDSGWLKAFDLPARITGGIFAGCVVVYILDLRGFLDLDGLAGWARTVLIIVGVFSGALFLGVISQEAISAVRERRKKRAGERAVARAQAKALAHLDMLSKEEIVIVVKALEEGSPSINWWAHSGGAAQLVEKGLLHQLAGTYNTEHWPFTFHDFVWEEMLRRSEQLLQYKAEVEGAKKKKRR